MERAVDQLAREEKARVHKTYLQSVCWENGATSLDDLPSASLVWKFLAATLYLPRRTGVVLLSLSLSPVSYTHLTLPTTRSV